MSTVNQALCKVLVKYVDSLYEQQLNERKIFSPLYTLGSQRLSNLPKTIKLVGSEITLRFKVYASSFTTCSLP